MTKEKLKQQIEEMINEIDKTIKIQWKKGTILFLFCVTIKVYKWKHIKYKQGWKKNEFCDKIMVI